MTNKISNFPSREVSEIAERESWRKEINRPIYHIHKYWAQRLGSVFRAILLYLLEDKSDKVWDEFYTLHNFSDKIILDPFMGSGTTIGEALKLGAKAIGCDINPISTFLVRQALTRVSLEKLDDTFREVESRAAGKIHSYYKTVAEDGVTELSALYYFWVKLVITPDGEEIPLFSKYVFAHNAYPSKKPEAQIVCPHCWNIFRGKYNDTNVCCPHCGFEFNPQQGPANSTTVTTRDGKKYKVKDLVPEQSKLKEKMYAVLAVDSDGAKKYLPIRDFDRALYEKATHELEIYNGFLPYYSVRPGYNTDQARGYNYLNWRDFFNDRQLLCLGILLSEIEKIPDKSIREQLLCLFSSTLEYNNMFCSYKGEGTGAVRPIFSNHIIKPERTPLENSVWGYAASSGCFSSLYNSRLLRAKKYLDCPFEIALDKEKGKCEKIAASAPLNPTICKNWAELNETDHAVLLMNGDSSKLDIPSESVDFVVTDPPYFDFIHYSELSDFFYAWLSPALMARDNSFNDDTSGRPNEVQQTDADTFSMLLGNVYRECRRVLKPNGKLAFSFHHSRVDGWYAIAKALAESELFIDEVIPVHAELMASTPKASAKEPISIDAMIICGKTAIDDCLSDIQSRALFYAREMSKCKTHVSKSDIFVICASQCLNTIVSEKKSEDEAKKMIESVQQYVQQRLD